MDSIGDDFRGGGEGGGVGICIQINLRYHLSSDLNEICDVQVFLLAASDEESVVPSQEWDGDVHENGAASVQTELVLHTWRQPRSSQLRDRTQVHTS